MARSNKTTREQRLRDRSQDRREQERQELRQLMLDAAGALFLERGYAGFSLRQVAEQIGYSPGTIYLYFRDKDDLLFHVADTGFRLFQEQQQRAALSASEPQARLRAVAQAYVRFGLEYPAYYRLMFVERPDLLFKEHAAEAAAWLATLNAYQQLFQEIAEEATSPAELQTLADVWWATVHGIVMLANSMGVVFDQARIDAMLAAALAQIMRALGREG